LDFDRIAPTGADARHDSAAAPALGGETCPEVSAPLLSFVVVNWNGGRFVGETLESIKRQDYAPYECVIVDNGSTDDSLSVIARHVDGDDRFRIITLADNLGHLGGAFVGLRATSGAFVALVDADDVLLPSFASVHIQVHLAVQANVAITTSNIIEVDSLNRAFSSSCPHLRVGPTDTGALRDEEVVVRLPTVPSAVYCRQLSKRVGLLPRDRAGWLWSPGTSNVLRRSVVAFFLVDEAAPRMRPADSYFLTLCHTFGGTAVIDMPLSTRRLHGTNYYARREAMPGLKSGPPEFSTTRATYIHEYFEILLMHARRNHWLLGSAFWAALDRMIVGGQRARWRFYARPEIVALFRRAAADLVEAEGAAALIRNIRARFGLRSSLAILRAAFRGPIPVRFYHLLLPRPHVMARLFLRRIVRPLM
jgi:glycosyltransferase involved in cell wall biosynthesis